MAQKGLWEQFKDNATTVFSDIREKVVEEGWFGRPTSPKENMAESLGWDIPGASPTKLNVNVNVAVDASMNIESKPFTWDDLRADARQSSMHMPAVEHMPDQEQGLDR